MLTFCDRIAFDRIQDEIKLDYDLRNQLWEAIAWGITSFLSPDEIAYEVTRQSGASREPLHENRALKRITTKERISREIKKSSAELFTTKGCAYVSSNSLTISGSPKYKIDLSATDKQAYLVFNGGISTDVRLDHLHLICNDIVSIHDAVLLSSNSIPTPAFLSNLIESKESYSDEIRYVLSRLPLPEECPRPHAAVIGLGSSIVSRSLIQARPGLSVDYLDYGDVDVLKHRAYLTGRQMTKLDYLDISKKTPRYHLLVLFGTPFQFSAHASDGEKFIGDLVKMLTPGGIFLLLQENPGAMKDQEGVNRIFNEKKVLTILEAFEIRRKTTDHILYNRFFCEIESCNGKKRAIGFHQVELSLYTAGWFKALLGKESLNSIQVRGDFKEAAYNETESILQIITGIKSGEVPESSKLDPVEQEKFDALRAAATSYTNLNEEMLSVKMTSKEQIRKFRSNKLLQETNTNMLPKMKFYELENIIKQLK